MRYSLEIEIGSYLFDHHFEGRCVLPAVEALITLAEVVQAHFPNINIRCLSAARFHRFLIIPQEVHHLPAFVEVDHTASGGISARLMTSVRSRTGGIGRSLEHARVEFSPVDSMESQPPSLPVSDNSERSVILVPEESIYPGLIPFGQAFQNIIGPVTVWPGGASATLSGGSQGIEAFWLGSPFPLDAAFHVACVWGQRFTGQVLFPTGFEKRTIHQKTKRGGLYQGRIFPAGSDRNLFLFEALIVDSQGTVCENIQGIQMQDVSQGRLRPPLWIKDL